MSLKGLFVGFLPTTLLIEVGHPTWTPLSGFQDTAYQLGEGWRNGEGGGSFQAVQGIGDKGSEDFRGEGK